MVAHMRSKNWQRVNSPHDVYLKILSSTYVEKKSFAGRIPLQIKQKLLQIHPLSLSLWLSVSLKITISRGQTPPKADPYYTYIHPLQLVVHSHTFETI